MLPTLGGYIREVALFALCCASLLIAGPVWVIFAFLIFALGLFVVIFLANLFVFVFFYFRKIACETGASRRVSRIRHCVHGSTYHLVDIVLESSAANTAYKYEQWVAEMEDLGTV